MEKIFKSKGMTTTEKWVIVFVLTFMCVAYLLLKEASALCGFIVAIPFLISNYQRKYIIKENGEAASLPRLYCIRQKRMMLRVMLPNMQSLFPKPHLIYRRLLLVNRKWCVNWCWVLKVS